MSVIKTIDEVIPFSKRHPNETVRMIIRYDSGYLKDLMIKDERLCFSKECFAEICRLTKGVCDNWEKPPTDSACILYNAKRYCSPYQYDFNDPRLIALNEERLGKEEF